MSLYDYEISREVARQDYPFKALIMAAMRQADSKNMEELRRAFPLVWLELNARYHAPGGILPGEPQPQEEPNDEPVGR